MKRKQINSKIPVLLFFFFFLFLTIVFVQLFFIAISPVVSGVEIKKFASNRNQANIKLYANRGTIYDKDENILALNVSSYTVIAFLDSSRTTNNNYPKHVVDKEETAKKLSPVLNMSEEQLLKLLNRNAYQVELGPGGRDITELKKEEIINLKLPGLGFIEDQIRYYPNGDFASYIIGYAKRYEKKSKSSEPYYDILGELGIESKFNDQLKGIDGRLIFQRDQYGYKIPDTLEERTDAINGKNIYLTLDATIQRFIEAEVKKVNEEYNPEWIQITAMDAKTGKILGSGTTPSFDPNKLNIVNYENPLTSYLFDPGSTMKIFTYMCAMEKGTYNSNGTFKSGKIKIGNNTVADWNQEGWGEITYDKGFEYSSNVGIANLLDSAIDKFDLVQCFKKYGFGEKTEIDLPRELVGSLKFNYPIEVVNAGFGQGISTTPIQHLQALTMVANNGTMLKPYIVDKIVDPNSKEIVYQGEVNKVENVISKSTGNKIKELMFNVIHGNDEGTTGTLYSVEGLDVIGKTGTSQIYDSNLKNYLSGPNDYIFSFSGIFPKDNPEIIIYAAMKKPKHSRNLGLRNATKNIMQNIGKYLNLNNEIKENNNNIYNIDSYISEDLNRVSLKLKNLNLIVMGDGDKIVNQFPKAGSSVLIGEKIFLKTNSNEILMPDVIGWTRGDVLNYCNLVKLNCSFNGYGNVVSQNIEKGTVLKEDSKLKIELEQKKLKDEMD